MKHEAIVVRFLESEGEPDREERCRGRRGGSERIDPAQFRMAQIGYSKMGGFARPE